MDSNLLVSIHKISVMLFLVTYAIKTILLFSNRSSLEKYTRITKVPEMIISFAFLVTGIWLFVIIGGIKVLQIVKLVLVVLSIPIAVIGFKKQRKGMALFSLLLIIGAYGLAEAAKSKPFIPKNDSVSGNANPLYADGATVYFRNCTFCHGSDGKKMYRNAPDLTQIKIGEDDIQKMIREGSPGKMPSYNIIVSDENIAAVAKYVSSLQSQK
jgi:mono/diheme cytochrome c family protein